MKNSKTSFTDEQLDALLKKLKRKSAERVVAYFFFSSVPLGAALGFFFSSLSPEKTFYICFGFYLVVLTYAMLTASEEY